MRPSKNFTTILCNNEPCAGLVVHLLDSKASIIFRTATNPVGQVVCYSDKIGHRAKTIRILDGTHHLLLEKAWVLCEDINLNDIPLRRYHYRV